MIDNEQLNMFSEGEPKQRKDKMKVSKVVLIVVALHVLVIGGFLLFEAFNREAPVDQPLSELEKLPEETAGTQPDVAALTPEAPTPDVSNLTPAAPGMVAPITSTTPMVDPLAAAPIPAPAPVVAPRTYSVKKGDSLWKIAKSEGVDMMELAQINNLTKTSILKIGQQLQLPSATTAEPVSIATGSMAPMVGSAPITGDVAASADLYVVKSGDSLWKIARNNGTSVKAIKEANQLSSDNLKIGQKLRLPGAAPATATTVASASTPSAPVATGSWNPDSFYEPGRYDQGGKVIHAVDNGETIDIIARNYGVRAADIIQANRISDPKKLYYGQPLVIPQPQPAATLPAPVSEPAAMLTTPGM